MQNQTRAYIRNFMGVIFATIFVVTSLLILASLKTQPSVNTIQLTSALSITHASIKPTQAVVVQPTTQVSQPVIEEQSQNSQQTSNKINSQTIFVMGFLSGSLATVIVFVVVLSIAKRKEMIERALQQEKEFQRSRSRRRVNEKMDNLLNRFRRTADEIQHDRTDAEALLLRKSNSS